MRDDADPLDLSTEVEMGVEEHYAFIEFVRRDKEVDYEGARGALTITGLELYPEFFLTETELDAHWNIALSRAQDLEDN